MEDVSGAQRRDTFLITLRLQVKERDDVAGVFGGRTILGRGKNLSQKHPDG